MTTQSTLLTNDRVRSELCRKQKHVYASCSSEASKHNKMLPSTYILEDTNCLYEDRWILNYSNVEFILMCSYEQGLDEFSEYIPSRVIQKCRKCDFGLDYAQVNDKKIKRVAVLMKNIQCLKFLTPHYLYEIPQSKSYFCYLSFFKTQLSIRNEDNDKLILLRSEPLLLTSLSTVSRAFHVSNHISNILKLIPSDMTDLKNIPKAACLRLSNITHLTINLSKEDVSTQLIDSLGLLGNLESLTIQLSDIETLAIFFELFAVNASKLPRLSELSILFDFSIDDWSCDSEELLEFVKTDYKWEHMLQHFEKEVGLSWRKDLKLSLSIPLLDDFQNDLFYHILPKKVANDGLSIKIDDNFMVSEDSYTFNFKFASEDLVLSHLKIEIANHLSLLDKILSRNEIIRTIHISEKSIKYTGIIEYIYENFSKCLHRIEKYAILLPANGRYLLTNEIDALVSLKELEIIWKPQSVKNLNIGLPLSLNYDVAQLSIKQIVLMIRNKKSLETFDLKFKKGHDLDDLDELFQGLFNLPRFKKFSLTFYFGVPMKMATSSNISKCLDLESKLGISRTQVTFARNLDLSYKVPSPEEQAALLPFPLHGYNNRYDYDVKIVYQKN